jgi:DNA polymerase-3 subunit alpha
MMFATLDDLGGAVEMLVFGKALAEFETILQADEIVLVKGRVDHKEAGSTCLVVQSLQRFAPTREEIERASKKAAAVAASAAAQSQPVHLRVAAADLCADTIDGLRQAIEDFPGPAEVLIDIDTSGGMRRVRLGSEYRVAHTPTLRAELEHALTSTAGGQAAVA